MTRTELRSYIKEELGYPQLQVELTDKQLDNCINKAVKQFTNIAYDGSILDYVLFECNGKGEYVVSKEIEEIVRIGSKTNIFSTTDMSGLIDENLSRLIIDSAGSAAGFLIHISSARSLMNKYFEKSINYNYNSYKKKLYILEDFTGKLLLEVRLRYTPDEDDDIFEQEWVQRMSVAQARMLQSVVLGKYNANIVSGATINYDNMRSLAENEIQKLEEELLSKWQELPPVLVG